MVFTYTASMYIALHLYLLHGSLLVFNPFLLLVVIKPYNALGLHGCDVNFPDVGLIPFFCCS